MHLSRVFPPPTSPITINVGVSSWSFPVNPRSVSSQCRISGTRKTVRSEATMAVRFGERNSVKVSAQDIFGRFFGWVAVVEGLW